MIPLPPGVIPPNFLPGAPAPNTPEGQHLMRNFLMDQQRSLMGGHSNNSSFSFPLFPPGMSEEDIHEFMQDPENQGKIKVIDHDMISRLYIYMSIYLSIYLSNLCHHEGCN
jgi:hypothetical protein